jgi:hypothetical protein
MSPMNSLNPAEQSFAVHLESLLGFAQELETQIHGITKPSGQLDQLLDAPLLLGAFNEAASLDVSHAMSVAEMHALLQDAREALTFAHDVTRTVAEGYSRLDADLGAYILASGVISDSDPAPAAVPAQAVFKTAVGVVAAAGAAIGVQLADPVPAVDPVPAAEPRPVPAVDPVPVADPVPAVDPALADPAIPEDPLQELPGFERGIHRFSDMRVMEN